MALVKHNNNSISDITSAGQLAQGKMTLISSQTASGSASIEFTSGIDSTYPIYRFEWINIHPSASGQDFQFNMSTDSGSNYNVTKTTTYFTAHHNESGSYSNLAYASGEDLAQSTGNQTLQYYTHTDNDNSCSGFMYLYNPSSSTFVKHFMSNSNASVVDGVPYSNNSFSAGYGNTNSSIDAVKFVMSSGNIDSGTIKLYGIKGD